MESSWAAQLPVLLLTVVRTNPVSTLVILILGLATAAPDVSVTVPALLAVA